MPSPDTAASYPDQVVDAVNNGILRCRYAVGQRLAEARLTESRMCRHIRKTGERIRLLPDEAFYRDEP